MLDLANLKSAQLNDPTIASLIEREVARYEQADDRLSADALVRWYRGSERSGRWPAALVRAMILALPLASSDEIRTFFRLQGPELAPKRDAIRVRLNKWGAGRSEVLQAELAQELDLALQQKPMPASMPPLPKLRLPIVTRRHTAEPPAPSAVSTQSVTKVVSPSTSALEDDHISHQVIPSSPPAAPRTLISQQQSGTGTGQAPPPEKKVTIPSVVVTASVPVVSPPPSLPVVRVATPTPIMVKPQTPTKVNMPLVVPNPLSIAKPVPVRTVAVSTGRPRMNDVAPPSRLVSPVEELRRMTLIDFRKLAANPTLSATRLHGIIDLLGRESFARRIEGIRAWRMSPLFSAYVTFGNQALRAAGGVKSVTQGETLTEDEFHAISDLNISLRK